MDSCLCTSLASVEAPYPAEHSTARSAFSPQSADNKYLTRNTFFPQEPHGQYLPMTITIHFVLVHML